MKQVLQNLRNGETRVVEVPRPQPGPGMVLVRTAASLVSAGTERMLVEFAGKSLLGKVRSRPDLFRQVLDKARREGPLSTLEAAFGRLEQPMPLGYSSAGTIISLGEGVDELRVGQRVACAGGGYAVHAEYATVPVNLVAALPDEVDFDSAAFATLGAIALHGFRLSEAALGERVAVIGLGLLGLLAVGIARAAGCAVFGVDLDPDRVALAESLGAYAVGREGAVDAALGFSSGLGCDVVLICADTASADPVELAGEIARDRAKVVAVGAVGLEMPRKLYYEKELSFINSRSYGPGRYDPQYEEDGSDYPIGYVRWTEGRNLSAIVDLLASGRLDVRPLISNRFPVEQAPEAYRLITGKSGEKFLGVLMTYSQEDELAEDTRVRLSASGAQVVSAEEVRLGVLGAGNFATSVLLPAIHKLPGLSPQGVISASGLNARHAADRFGFRYAGSDPQQVLDDPDVNTVAILTRHHLHARQTLDALNAGKHVFCEKPLALNLDQLEEIEDALRAPDAPLLTVGFNRRFSPMAEAMKAFISASEESLVAHYRVNAGYIPLTHWVHDAEQGGGRIIGEGCHFIDFITFLVGAAPVEVSASGLPDGGRYREDNLIITLRFPEGSIASLHYLANGDKAFAKERVEVFRGGRVAVLDDFRSLEMVNGGRRQVERSRLRQDKGHRAEWQALVRAIQAGGPPTIPYEQISGVTRASFAAVRSLREGGAVQAI